MSGNEDREENNGKENSDEESPSLKRSNKDQGVSGTESSPKEGASDHKRGRSRKRKRKDSKKRRRVSSTSSDSSPEKKRKKSRKKKKKHRRKRDSSSSSSNSETSSADEGFQVISEEDQYKYSLPQKIATYINDHFSTYMKDPDIKKQVLLKNPVPNNVNKAKKLDEFVRDILKEKHKPRDLDLDSTFEKIQTKNINVLGPLSKLYLMIKKASASDEEEVSIELDQLKEYVEQSICLIGQATNAVTYQRRFHILSALNCSPQQAKEMLREKADLLKQDDKNLFGKKFNEHLISSAKSKKQTIELFCDKGKRKKPFQYSPSEAPRRSSGGRQKILLKKNSSGQARQQHYGGHQQNNNSYNRQGKRKQKGNLVHYVISTCNSQQRIKKRTSDGKKVILCKRGSKIATCRKIKAFSGNMETSDTGFRNPGSCEGVQNTISRESNPNKGTNNTSNEFNSKTGNTSGNRQYVEEGSNMQDQSFERGVSEQYVPSREKGRGESSCDQFEIPESVHTVSALQNGGPVLLKRNVTGGRFHVQTGHEGCLLYSTTSSSIEKICQIFLVREPLRVPLPLFRLRPSTTNIYETVESSNISAAADKYSGYHIPRRYAFDGSNNGGNFNVQRYDNLPSATSRVYSEYGEIPFESSSRDRISWCDSQFSKNDTFTTSTKNSENSGSVSRFICERFCDSIGTDKINRSFNINNTSCTSSKIKFSLSSATTSKLSKAVWVIPRSSILEQGVKRGTAVVDSKFETLQWTANNTNTGLCYNKNGCLQEGLGSILSRDPNKGGVDIRGKRKAYKHSGVEGGEVSFNVISQTNANESNTFSNRQHYSLDVLSKNGGYWKQRTFGPIQRDMELSPETWDHNYSRISTKFSKCRGRLAVKEPQGQFRVETSSPNIPKNLRDKRDPRSGLVCISSVPPTSKLLCMEARPIQSRDRCNAASMVQSISVCIPTICNDQQSSKQGKTGQGGQNATCDTHLAISNLVPSTTKPVNRQTDTFTAGSILAHKSEKGATPTFVKQNTKVSGVDSFRQKLSTEGFSDTASKLISCVRRESTLSTYNSAWAQWVGWCSEGKIDPFRCNLNQIVNYLSSLYDKGLQYSTIGCHRSAISAYHEYIDGKPVGQHPKVCAILKGVFNQRPPQPRYVFIWDVQTVLNHIKSEWGCVEALSDKLLTLKLVMLLALTSASRSSAIHHLDIRYKVKYNEKYVFKFHKLHKSWRYGKPSPDVEFYKFSDDKDLCVVTTIDEYINRTEKWRGENKTQLLLSFIEPHEEVSSSTVSRWIKETLKLSGIDINTFKGHSTRSASSSKAGSAGLSVSDILNRGSWSQESTWQRFYNKPIINSNEAYQKSVLS